MLKKSFFVQHSLELNDSDFLIVSLFIFRFVLRNKCENFERASPNQLKDNFFDSESNCFGIKVMKCEGFSL